MRGAFVISPTPNTEICFLSFGENHQTPNRRLFVATVSRECKEPDAD